MRNITTTKKCTECGLCCYFTKKEVSLSPFFSKQEMKKVDNDNLKKNEDGTFQAKVLKSKKKKGKFVCSFLDEEKYRCSIYPKRPIDCMMWPFILGWDKKKRDVCLWVSDESFCPAVDSSKIAKSKDRIDNIINYLKKNKYFDEVANKERRLWPYEKYQVKLKKITKSII